MNIKRDLVRFNEAALPDTFVALGTQLDGSGNPYHAGIIIRLKGIEYLHHYTGAEAQLVSKFETDSWFVYKIANFIAVDDENEVGAFLQHCKRVCDKSEITYSCVLDGSTYAADGTFESASGLPELGTCVGFCINTLSIACIDSDTYLQLEDWDESSIPENFPLDNFGQRQTFSRYPNLDRGLYNAFRKRISPLEYLCSAFFNEQPVRKNQIDEIRNDVREMIYKKFQLA